MCAVRCLPGDVGSALHESPRYPIKVGAAVVGGIGVSGGHYSQDMEVAQAGLSALASV
jgi:Haem-degrading